MYDVDMFTTEELKRILEIDAELCGIMEELHLDPDLIAEIESELEDRETESDE
jgi:hypothetical protein